MLPCTVKISIALIGTLISFVTGDFDFNHFGTFNFDEPDEMHQPWFESHYGGSPSFKDNLKHGTDPIPSIKKIPTEDKAFKKSFLPFHGLSDYEDPKIKEFVLKTGGPHCQEIAAKDTNTQASKDSSMQNQMTCYRCKDPKNGSVYEQCSYNSKPPSSNSRGTRSNAAAERTVDSLTAASKDSKNVGSSGLPDSYKFSDDYFHPQASMDLPVEQEKNADNCKKVVKDSMVCMVCKDPHTNGKYEQCSYVAQPNEKAFAYTKSSSFGKPKGKSKHREDLKKVHKKKPKKHNHHRREEEEDEDQEEEQEREPEANHRHYRQEEPEEYSGSPEAEHSDEESKSAEDKEGHGSHYVPDHSYHYPSYKGYKANYGGYDADEDEKDAAPAHNVKSKASCKTVQKDGQSCTVCTNPKTGGQSENCNYSHEPKDKSYKYTKSKSFGYPESKNQKQQNSNYGGYSAEKSSESPEKQESDSGSDENYSGYAGEPSTVDYIRSESEKISKNVKDQGECREEKRDSMICKICKDPNTGDDFEQCNYSYDPEDKVFAYSKSKSFGSPTKASDDDEDNGSSSSSSSGSEERPEESYSFPVIYPTGTSPLDYIPKGSESKIANIYSTEKPEEKSSVDRVDTGFYDATMRRAEIEKIVKDIDAEDKSKCEKIQRGDMTCYECKDPKGFLSEECVYVASPHLPSATSSDDRVPAATSPVEVTAKLLDSSTTTTTTTSTTARPTNWKSIIIKRKTRATEEKTKDKDEELEVLDEEQDEAEPYDYVAETRPVFDKIFGVTLPAYMVERSKHEVEFDELSKF